MKKEVAAWINLLSFFFWIANIKKILVIWFLIPKTDKILVFLNNKNQYCIGTNFLFLVQCGLFPLLYCYMTNSTFCWAQPLITRKASEDWNYLGEILFCYQNCYDLRWEKIVLVIEAEGREFAKIFRSLEQFIQTVKGQNNFW